MARSLGLSHSYLLSKRLNSRGQSQLGLLYTKKQKKMSLMLHHLVAVLQVHGYHLVQQVQLLLEKTVNQEYQLSRINVVCVFVHSKRIREGALAWSGCCGYAKGGSMKNVAICEVEYDEQGRELLCPYCAALKVNDIKTVYFFKYFYLDC